MKTNLLFLILPILFIGGCLGPSIGPLGSTHQHGSFAVYINDQELNFTNPKYELRSKYVHLEGGDFTTIHKHATGVTVGYFFDTLGYKFDNNCFATDTGNSYCNNGQNTLKFYVNGLQNQEFGNHEIHDGEHYLITYGNDNDSVIKQQIASVPDPHPQ